MNTTNHFDTYAETKIEFNIDPDDVMVNIKTIAKVLGVSVDTIKRMMKPTTLPNGMIEAPILEKEKHYTQYYYNGHYSFYLKQIKNDFFPVFREV